MKMKMKTGGFQFKISDDSFKQKVECDPSGTDCVPLVLSVVGLHPEKVVMLQKFAAGVGVDPSTLIQIFRDEGMVIDPKSTIEWSDLGPTHPQFPTVVEAAMTEVSDDLRHGWGRMILAGWENATTPYSNHIFIIYKDDSGLLHLFDPQLNLILSSLEDILKYIIMNTFSHMWMLTIKNSDGEEVTYNPSSSDPLGTRSLDHEMTQFAGQGRVGKKYRSKRKRFIKKNKRRTKGRTKRRRTKRRRTNYI
jgi:hypothetical protein